MKTCKVLALCLVASIGYVIAAAMDTTSIVDINDNMMRTIINEAESVTRNINWNQLISKLTAIYYANPTQIAMANEVKKKQEQGEKQDIIGISLTKPVSTLRDEVIVDFTKLDTQEIMSKISEISQVLKKSQSPSGNTIDTALYTYLWETIYYYASNLLKALNIMREESLDQTEQNTFALYTQEMIKILEACRLARRQ